jgi:Cd2+/Zn2+-exporting ATPase
VFGVRRIVPASSTHDSDGKTERQLLRLAAHAEAHSSHPIARSIREAYTEPLNHGLLSHVSETKGRGVRAFVAEIEVLAGSERFIDEHGVNVDPEHRATSPAGERAGSPVYIAADGKYLGYIIVSDEVRPEARETVKRLHASGIDRIAMLTGDSKPVAEAVAREIGIDAVYAELLPEGKVERLEEIIRDTNRLGSGAVPGSAEQAGQPPSHRRTRVAFVGDGINDAPVLTRSDAGFAMGALGTDAAIEAADIVIMDDSIDRVARAFAIAKRTRRIVIGNILLALAAKLAFLALGAVGIATMWEAVIADVGITVLAVLNSSRALRVESARPRIGTVSRSTAGERRRAG